MRTFRLAAASLTLLWLAALKFLGHWIGDIHQPLHVSFEDDREGGKIKESGPCSNNLPAFAPIVRKLT